MITEERNTENATLLALRREGEGTSLVVQWLRLHTPNAGGLGSIPGQGTRSQNVYVGFSIRCYGTNILANLIHSFAAPWQAPPLLFNLIRAGHN